VAVTPPSGSNVLLTRILSAAILAPVAIVVAYVGGWPFVLFWTAAAIAILWEWMGLVAPENRVALAAGAAAIVLSAPLAMLGRPLAALLLLAIGAIAAALSAPSQRRSWAAGGVVYAGLMLMAPLLLRGDAMIGAEALFLLFAIVWTTDVLGYFAGRAIGGPKLAPSISPAKTWSGAAAGLVGAAIVVALGVRLVPQARLTTLIAVAIALSIMSQLGDLLESAFKRRFGTKDTSQLIPGHGGVMDRLDGFWAAAVCAALFGVLRGGFAEPAAGLLLW
jgi:phosphatidate cytidylyltransferase